MSDESISGKEDKENLLYIAQGIHVEELSFGEDHAILRESIAGDVPEVLFDRIGSDVNLIPQFQGLGPDVLSDPDIIARTRPFELKWSFGMNAKVPIRNLTNDKKKQFLFASSHFPIIYDYCENTMQQLEGHGNVIKDLACSKTGRWIVTVGSTNTGNVMIWDNNEDEISLVRTIFEPYPFDGVEIVEISGSARYLIMIGNSCENEFSVDFWLWTEGKESPQDTYKVPKAYGKPMSVCFNPDVEEHIMVVFEHQVFLMVWDTHAKLLSNIILPQLLHKKKIGLLTDGTYITMCHECYATSSTGCILVFGNTLYPRPFGESELDNSKLFRNAVKVSTGSIHCCTTSEDLVITADSRGVIQFFDKKIRIVYWLRDFNLGPIYSISFNLTSKFKYEEQNQYITSKPRYDRLFKCGFQDISEELEILYKKDLPETATLTREPLTVRDFLVTGANSSVYLIDPVFNKCIPLFHIADGNVTAIETHDEINYLLVGYSSGTILLINFENNNLISKLILPEGINKSNALLGEEKKNAITCLKYSVESFHLICGRENGEIWVLEPILLTPKEKPFTVTEDAVMKIDFSYAPIQFAYYDSNRTVVLFSFDLKICKWILTGKIRTHYQAIHDIMFMPGNPYSKLYTISKDRHLVEYNNSTLKDGKFEILSRVRIDQSAIPMCFTYWFETNEDKQRAYIFVSDNSYKMKFLYQSTKIPKTLVLGPAYGCFKNDCVRKMLIVPGCESRYMIFSTKQFLGLHILPPDGNPYKYVGYLAHPNGLVDFQLSHDGSYIFSFAENDAFVFKWEIRTRAVELMNVLGGKELEPFYCLIAGGATGPLFQEMKDLFYYVQILQQENMDLPKRVLDTISVNEIPDLVRTCGFFPSEFELENMMIDIRYRNFDDTQKTNEEINFIDFVKLYCNHKPAHGYALKDLEEAFALLARNADDFVGDKVLSREELITLFTASGEPMSSTSAFKCFKTLLRNYDAEESFDFLPEKISFEIFRDEILGVDMLRDKFQEGDGSDRSLDISVEEVTNKKTE